MRVSPIGFNKTTEEAARRKSTLRAPDSYAETFQVDVFGLLGLAETAAIEADAQEQPESQRLAIVVVAVQIAVALDEPAPGAPLGAGVSVFLPALEHAHDRLQGVAPRPGVVAVQPQ